MGSNIAHGIRAVSGAGFSSVALAREMELKEAWGSGRGSGEG